MCDCSWCVCAAELNKIGRAFHGEPQRNNPFLFCDYNWCTFIWEFKKCTSQGKKNTALSANSEPEHVAFLCSFFWEGSGDREEEKALMKARRRRMRGALEKSLRIPVSGSQLGGTAWLLPPAGRLSRCLSCSAALTKREWDLGQEKKKKNTASPLSCSSEWCKIFQSFFYYQITWSYCIFNSNMHKQHTNKAG